MKIIADDNIPYLKGRLEPFADVTYVDQDDFTPGLVKDADALMIRTRTRCDSRLLDGSSVKMIATATIGMDQFDLPWCHAAGIETANAPGCNAPGVAQYVWSALLRAGFDPEKMTLGVVGHGNVGSIVARWGDLLGAKVLVCDPPRAEAGMTDRDYVRLERLLAESDAVTLHTPLLRDGRHPTHHLIGSREISLMRPGAILVNAARGSVIDTIPVKEALRDGRIRAIIDTWEGEPVIDRELLEMAEYGTFHIAGYSRQGKQRATRMALEAVGRHFGIDFPTDGLEGPYAEPQALTPGKIMDSYDPAADTAMLRSDPAAFERLRAEYNYRPEVL
ncbi:MAG: 4-phosphoerythronate dehydrogenase [Muribaculaceae bacterium]|nr:4-phosphoerythronate dehydrogenase [Muribaculaceae bacterium]